ncbi:MAG: substrate-binding domain-containing protein [Dehalococcoidia bacterium]
MLRLRAFLIGLAILALAAGGCGDSDKDDNTPASGSAATAAPPARAKPSNPDIILSTTTSTVDSGLLDVLQPLFEEQTGYRLTILSQGSGAALKTGERGEADVVLVHSPDAEAQFMGDGHGTRRELVMHNDFIVVGPEKDPAGVRASSDINDVMRRIAAAGAPFISRGDDSGTHALERKLWQQAGLTPAGQSWYQESGSGMGQTLQIASEKAAYTLADRGTYLNLRKNLALDVLRENDGPLLNVYHVIQVDPAKTDKVNAEGAAALIDFLVSPDTQHRIGEYGKDRFGQPLFVPDYGKDERTLGS